MEKLNKTGAFEYFVYKLIEWQKEVKKNDDPNDIGILKALKLLFFVSAVDTNKKTTHSLLDTTFSNFCALPFGHVESDVYNAIKNKELDNLDINNYTSVFKNKLVFEDKIIKQLIDSSIEKLKGYNENLITYSSFDLVELSHKWYSWKYFFSKAKKVGLFSTPIPIDFIKAEEKYYSL